MRSPVHHATARRALALALLALLGPPLSARALLPAATLLGPENDVGTLEAGKFADLVAVPDDLLANNKLVSKVSLVMKHAVIDQP